MQLSRQVLLLSLALTTARGLAAQALRVRDSAGVRIVENAARATAPIAFTLASKPLSDLGGLKTKPEDELDLKSPSLRLDVLSNGNQVVIENARVRLFDNTGKQLAVVGREGEGPREFRQIQSICHTRGDTIVLHDPPQNRVTILDKRLEYVREFRVPRASPIPYGCFDDGTFVIREVATPMSDAAGFRMSLTRWHLDGKHVDTLGFFWAGGPFNMYLTPSATFGIWRNRIYFGDPRSSEVKIFDGRMKLTGIIRTSDPIARLTAAERAALQSPAGRGGIGAVPGAAAADDPLKPTTWPSYGEISIEPNGRLWIADHPHGSRGPVLWTAFDSTGALLGKMSLPPGLVRGEPRVLGFPGGGVLMRREDAEGAQRLAIQAIVPVKKP